jgi:hypothetical protein
MPKKLVLFNGGLVTSRDPSSLRSDDVLGELSRADDAEYLPDDPGIWPVPGRSAFNSTAEADDILSGGFFEWEPSVKKFIILVADTYRVADAASSGSFSDLVTGLDGSATQFDSANMQNEHILFNGVDRNQVVSSDMTTQPQGMLAAVAAPTVSRDAGAVTGFILSSGNTITYWFEERVKSGTTIVRRSASAVATTVTLTGDGTTDKPRVSVPTLANSDATHVALFATETNGQFPVGAEIAEIAVGAASFIDDTRTGTNPGFPSGDTYPTVAVELNSEATTTPKYGEPPVSSTGDVFEGSIVQNDVANEDHVRFTAPGDLHAHPGTNVIKIRTKHKDRVVWIRTLGRAVLVGMANSLQRLDTLPLPEDASFQPDRVRTEVEGAFGGVSARAVAKFSYGAGSSLIAYVSPHGIIVTDGVTWDVLSADLDWEATTAGASLADSVLINNPRRFRLEFYYTPAEGSANTKALYLYYHPSHIKNVNGRPRAKVTGPINVNANGAFMAALSPGPSGFYAFTCGSDGVLYQEGVGVVDASSSGGIAFNVRSGDQYLTGVGDEAIFRRGWLHHSAGASGQTATATLVARSEGEDDLTETEEIDVDRREATGVYEESLGDAFQFGVSMTNPIQRVRFNYLMVEFDPAYEEQSP